MPPNTLPMDKRLYEEAKKCYLCFENSINVTVIFITQLGVELHDKKKKKTKIEFFLKYMNKKNSSTDENEKVGPGRKVSSFRW